MKGLFVLLLFSAYIFGNFAQDDGQTTVHNVVVADAEQNTGVPAGDDQGTVVTVVPAEDDQAAVVTIDAEGDDQAAAAPVVAEGDDQAAAAPPVPPEDDNVEIDALVRAVVESDDPSLHFTSDARINIMGTAVSRNS